jgi:hypothetical protein
VLAPAMRTRTSSRVTLHDVGWLHKCVDTDLTNEEGDISNLCQYDWYQWCYYRENTSKFPFNSEILGRILGPAKGEGNEMTQWTLKANGNVVPRRTVHPLNTAELHSVTELKKRNIFDARIEGRWGTSTSAPLEATTDDEFEEYRDDDEDPRIIPDVEDTVDADGRLLNQQPMYDRIINAEVQLQQGNELCTSTVVQRALGPDGTTTVSYADKHNCGKYAVTSRLRWIQYNSNARHH